MLFIFLTITTVKAQLFGTQDMIEEENISLKTWAEDNINNYAGIYSFGESEAESSLHLSISDRIICAQLKKGDWVFKSGQTIGWHFTYENYTNVKIIENNFYSDQSNGEFVSFKHNNKQYKGLKLFNPPIQMGNNGEFEIGSFSEVDKLGKYFKTKTEVLSIGNLKKKNKEELKIMRNEIYARYHYLFKTKKMSDHFNKQEWYTGYYQNVDSFLTEIENENIKKIRTVEKKAHNN